MIARVRYGVVRDSKIDDNEREGDDVREVEV